MGTQLPSPYCGQTAEWIEMPLGTEVELGPGGIALDGDPAPPKGGYSTPMYCSQTAAWIKMPLCMEVNLVPGDLLLDGEPAPPPQKGSGTPKFSAHVCCGQTTGWIKMPNQDQDALLDPI